MGLSFVQTMTVSPSNVSFTLPTHVDSKSHYRFTLIQPISESYMSNTLFVSIIVEHYVKGDGSFYQENINFPYYIGVKINNKLYSTHDRDFQPDEIHEELRTDGLNINTQKIIFGEGRTTGKLYQEYEQLFNGKQPHYARYLPLLISVDYSEIKAVNHVEILFKLVIPSLSWTPFDGNPMITMKDPLRIEYHMEKVSLYNLQGDDKIEAYIHLISSKNYFERYSAFLAGFHRCNLPYLANLNAQRYEVLAMDDHIPTRVSSFQRDYWCPTSYLARNMNQPSSSIINNNYLNLWLLDSLESMFDVFDTTGSHHISMIHLDMIVRYTCMRAWKVRGMDDCGPKPLLQYIQRHFLDRSILQNQRNKEFDILMDIITLVHLFVAKTVQFSLKTVTLFTTKSCRQFISAMTEIFADRAARKGFDKSWLYFEQENQPNVCRFKRLKFGVDADDKSHIWFDDMEIWLLDVTNWMDLEPCHHGEYDQAMSTQTLFSNSSNDVIFQDPQQIRYSEVLGKDDSVGKSFILISNVCASYDAVEVPFVNSLIMTGKHQLITFSPINSTTLLVDWNDYLSEDKGFLYTGARLVQIRPGMLTLNEEIEDKFLVRNRHLSDAEMKMLHLQTSKSWLRGTTAWIMSVSPDHLSHDSEIFVHFVTIAKEYYDCILDSVTDPSSIHSDNVEYRLRTCSQYSNNFDHFIEPIIHRFVMAKSLSYKAVDWIRRMVSIFIDYYYDRTLRGLEILSSAALNIPSHGAIPPTSSINEKRILPLIKKLSLPRLLYHDSVFGVVNDLCFEKLALIGRSNGHVTYFTSELVGHDLKCHVYEKLSLKVESLHHTSSTMREINFLKLCPLNKLNVLPSILNQTLFVHPRNRKIKITMTVRSGIRRNYLNIYALQDMIKKNKLSVDLLSVPIDMEWFENHIFYAGALTLQQQAEALAETDIFITAHGAEVMNGLFLRSGSVVIDIFNGGFYEFYFDPMLREIGVKLIPLPVMNHGEQTKNCEKHNATCVEGSVIDGNALNCLGVRNCNIRLDLKQLQLALQQAYLHLLSAKFMFVPKRL